MTPLCVVCGSVCPDPGLWVVRGGEACSQGCARGPDHVPVPLARRMVELIDDYHDDCDCEVAS